MPDDVPEPEVEWPEEDPPAEAAETAHDDIMKRLLDYQRSLREGASPEEAAEAMKRGTGDPSLVEASSAAESLAELLSTEVAPDEIPAPELEAEPTLEAEAVPGIEAPEEPEPKIEAPVEAFEPVVQSPPEAMPADALDVTPEPEPEPELAAESPTTEDEVGMATGSRTVLEARVGSLEGKLDDLGAKIAELRRNFQTWRSPPTSASPRWRRRSSRPGGSTRRSSFVRSAGDGRRPPRLAAGAVAQLVRAADS